MWWAWAEENGIEIPMSDYVLALMEEAVDDGCIIKCYEKRMGIDIINPRETNGRRIYYRGRGMSYMDKKYTCYCGLYCENCATKSKVEPAAKALHAEMQKAGFEDIITFLPDGETFWRFLSSVAKEGACTSCRDGSGNPGCGVRICAQQKGVQMCAFCDSYPCDQFIDFFQGYPMLKEDNALLRNSGWDAWAQLQDERKAKGFTYSENK